VGEASTNPREEQSFFRSSVPVTERCWIGALLESYKNPVTAAYIGQHHQLCALTVTTTQIVTWEFNSSLVDAPLATSRPATMLVVTTDGKIFLTLLRALPPSEGW
jgi:hypothetical protein